jgi:hypothetical protein
MTEIVLPRDNLWLPDPVGSLRDSASRVRRWWWKTKEDALTEAIALDTPLGGTVNDTAATTLVHTTTAAVASSGFIVLGVTCAAASSLTSVTGGGLTWTIDKTNNTTGALDSYIVSAQAPSGLATSTALTANYSASTAARGIGGASFTGVATSTPVDTTLGPKQQAAVTAWVTDAVTIQAGSVLINFNATDGGALSSVTSPSVEDVDVNAGAAAFGIWLGHRIEPSAGAYTIGGTYATAIDVTLLQVAYKTGAPPSPFFPTRNRNVKMRMKGR